MERTLILLKPDAYARSLSGEIIARFERKSMRVVAARVLTMTHEMARSHYAEHVDQPFYPGLADFITSGPLIALVLEGDRAIDVARQLIGTTDPLEAAPGTIRGDFGIQVSRNLVHGSDGPAAATREIALFFPEFARPARATELRAAQLV